MEHLALFVPGKPQSRGSKSPHVVRRKGGAVVMTKEGRPIIAVKDNNPKSKDWMAAISASAAALWGKDLLTEPITFNCVFFFARPKSHYGTGRNAGKLKASAPEFHTQKPDMTKLLRGVEDALTGVVWKDDSLIFRYETCLKAWTSGVEGVLLRVGDYRGLPLHYESRNKLKECDPTKGPLSSQLAQALGVTK